MLGNQTYVGPLSPDDAADFIAQIDGFRLRVHRGLRVNNAKGAGPSKGLHEGSRLGTDPNGFTRDRLDPIFANSRGVAFGTAVTQRRDATRWGLVLRWIGAPGIEYVARGLAEGTPAGVIANYSLVRCASDAEQALVRTAVASSWGAAPPDEPAHSYSSGSHPQAWPAVFWAAARLRGTHIHDLLND